MTTPSPAYLPPDLAAYIREELASRVDTATLWEIERVCEAAYARGYGDGHDRGHTGAWVSAQREHARQQVAQRPTPTATLPAVDPRHALHPEGTHQP